MTSNNGILIVNKTLCVHFLFLSFSGFKDPKVPTFCSAPVCMAPMRMRPVTELTVAAPQLMRRRWERKNYTRTVHGLPGMHLRLICSIVLWKGRGEIIPIVNLFVTGNFYETKMYQRIWYYRKTSTISRTLVGNKIVDNSDVVGASPVGAAPTTSSFST